MRTLIERLKEQSDILSSSNVHIPILNEAATEIETLTASLAEVTRERNYWKPVVLGGDFKCSHCLQCLGGGLEASLEHAKTCEKSPATILQSRLTTLEAANNGMMELLKSAQAAYRVRWATTTAELKSMVTPYDAALTTPTPNAERQSTQECPACGGDGIETCDNPDHGFISAVGGETSRLGCPGCGSDPEHKTGHPCPKCNGTGSVPNAERTDGDRLDWLSHQRMDVRIHTVQITSRVEEGTPNNLRAAIDAAINAEKGQQ